MEQKALGESVTHTVHFSYSELKCDTITGEDGIMYNLLSYYGMVNEGDLGYPTLPKKDISIPIPYSAENISLSAERRNVTWCEYDLRLHKEYHLRQYVIHNVDKAVENEWIMP